MSIESPETIPDRQAEVAIQVGKASPGNRSRTRRAIIIGGAILLSAGVAFFVYSGIQSRIDAEKGLEKRVILSSAAVVNVIHSIRGSDDQAIELPGNTQAFTEAPIYARTSGYLKQWYFDIGARVKRGQLLAEIETPELDEQLEQAENQLKTPAAPRGDAIAVARLMQPEAPITHGQRGDCSFPTRTSALALVDRKARTPRAPGQNYHSVCTLRGGQLIRILDP
jgi:multidrug efflux pump subunit AcrA (membrane-fusion protein)